MTFNSILFQKKEDYNKEQVNEEPAYFKDLNLNQIVDAITAGKQEFNLKPFFYTPLHNEDTIQYRHEVMRDLESETLFKQIKLFSQSINSIEKSVNEICEHLERSESYYCNYLEKGSFLDSVKIYCEAINGLVNNLVSSEIKSRGLSSFYKFISDYAKSEDFKLLLSETDKIKADLSTVKYCMLIKGGSIKVRKFENEIDHTAEIEEIFQKFKQGAVKDYRQKIPEEPYAVHVEAGVLDLVAKLYPDIFSSLDDYCKNNKSCVDKTILTFSKEIQFYIAYLEYIEKFKHAGLHFCYPQLIKGNKEVCNINGFDLSLANKLISQNQTVVCNDFYLQGKERIIIVSGPNQGGKTTFARTFGQLHHMASIACPVPGNEAKLFMFDRIFTHFEREENIESHNGKLQDDLVRMYDILNQATTDSIIIINEILSSTTLKDAVFIGEKIMEEIVRLDLLCVFVTFLDELSLYSEKNVSMASTVIPEDPVHRTFKIVRRPADGLAYAINIAEKYRLTYDSLKERIKT